MSGGEVAFQALLWASAAVALLRWPWRASSVAVAGLAWLMWGAAAAVWIWLGCVLLGSLVHRAWETTRGPVQGNGLLDRPRVAAVVLSAAVTVLAPWPVMVVGLVALVVSLWWLGLGMAEPAQRWVDRLTARRSILPPLPQRRRSGDVVADQAVVLVAEIEDFLAEDGPAKGTA